MHVLEILKKELEVKKKMKVAKPTIAPVEHKAPAAEPEKRFKATSEIDDIFGRRKRKKTEAGPDDDAGQVTAKRNDKGNSEAIKLNSEGELVRPKKKLQVAKPRKSTFAAAAPTPRKKTEDGFTVYSAEELGFNKRNAGGTKLCPFDFTFLFAYSCTFPMQSHESQVSAIVAQLGGSGARDSSGGVGNVGHLVIYKGRAWSFCIVLAMLELQLLRRLSESLHISHYSRLARMHVLGYLIGLGFYPAASLTLFSQYFEDRDYLAALSTFVVKRLGRAWVLHTGPPLFNSQIQLMDYAKSLNGLNAHQWVGLGVFLLGWIQQFRLHSILASLRRKKAHTGIEVILKPFSSVDKRRTERYEIPRGSWFEWVSCAHYLAEVLYAGIVIASNGLNLNMWLFSSWVVLNLTLAARETHAWYKSKFEDYPPFRRAMFPFIY